MQLDDIHVVRQTLQDGIDKGYWTLEDLDKETPGLYLLKEEVRQHRVYELRNHPFPVYRNLLRENHHPEKVQAAPDPRDFESNPGSPVQRTSAPLHVPGGDDPVVSNVDPVAQHDGTSSGEHRQDEAPVGTTGEPPASDGGASSLW